MLSHRFASLTIPDGSTTEGNDDVLDAVLVTKMKIGERVLRPVLSPLSDPVFGLIPSMFWRQTVAYSRFLISKTGLSLIIYKCKVI